MQDMSRAAGASPGNTTSADAGALRYEAALGGAHRQALGSFYTPPHLIALVLDCTLSPLIDAALAAAEPEEALLGLRVVDPACGTGHFLVEVATRIAHALETTPAWRSQPARQGRAFAAVATRCVYGVDIDGEAVRWARERLAARAGASAELCEVLTVHVRQGDALLGPTGRELQAGGGIPEGALDWAAAFPDAMRGEMGGFDAVVGNPPFLNAIEAAVPDGDKARLRLHHPELGGTADRAFHFLARAVRVLRPKGRVGLIQPRALLASDAAAGLRSTLTAEGWVERIYAPDTATFFSGACVYVCAVVLGAAHACWVSTSADPTRIQWVEVPRHAVQPQWWTMVQRALGAVPPVPPAGCAVVGDVFEVRASMTTGDYYAAQPHIAEAQDGSAEAGAPPRSELGIATTGLIDPGVCYWGERRARILGRDFARPVLREGSAYPPSLTRRMEAARRPKLLVAGLAKRMECFLDEDGCYLGAVATWSITHPEDDTGALRRLAAHLHDPRTTVRFRSELGGNALGGGNITVTKAFLRNLPLAWSEEPSLDDAGDCVPEV